MKSFFYLFTAAMLIMSCSNSKESSNTTSDTDEKNHPMAETHDIFGDKEQTFNDKMELETVFAKYESMEAGDSMRMVFEAEIKDVCAVSGCWMKLGLNSDETTHVTFKDYGFFMPKDAAGKEAVVTGWAHKKETSVDMLKHYAEDAGKPQEEIDAITEPELGYSFVADAVLIKKES